VDSFVSWMMVTRIIPSLVVASPITVEAIINNALEPYLLPQAIRASQYRNHSPSSPGMISKIGLNTVVDPRLYGGKMNDAAREDLVSLIEINDEEYLHYRFPKVDIALLWGTYADESGNIYLNHDSHLR